jgi:hypothetical protein
MAKELSGGIFCIGIYRAENYPLAWLPVQHDRSIRSCYHQRDYCEILFSINNDRERGMSDRMLKRADKVISQCASGIFYPDVFTVDFRHPSAWRAHGMTVNNCDIRDDTFFLEVVGDNIPDSVYDVAQNFRHYLIKVPV